MNKQQKIYNLAQKYFVQQKAKEISLGFIILILAIFVPYFLGILTGVDVSTENEFPWPDYIDYWLVGGAFLAGAGLIIVILSKIISSWLKSNWKKAERRAEAELK